MSKAKSEVKEKEILSSIIVGYTTDIQTLEEENKILRESVTNMKKELQKFQHPPLLVAEIKDVIGDNVLIKLNNGNEFFVGIGPNMEDVKPGDSVLVEQKNLTVLKQIPVSKAFNVEKYVIVEKPNISWSDVGGLDRQAEEIREVIELPLIKPELFKKVGIQPPKGILLYGPPGTGKTLLAKAVATATDATFIEVVGSELVQKFIGEGAKLIKEIFQLAREKAPAVIFIDEVDALASKRMDVGTSGEREVQRTFMQLLAEIDGFKPLGNIKIIGCTNRKDILDPAVVRPGRLDRLIEIPVPNKEGILEICGLVDPELLPGHQAVLIGVKLSEMNLVEKGAAISKLNGVISVSVVTGRFDLIILVLLKKGFGLLEFYTNEVSQIDGIRSVETFVVYKSYNLKLPYIY